MTDLVARYERVKERIAHEAGSTTPDLRLVAVSKYVGLPEIRALASLGHLDFGESRIQQAREKISAEPDLIWHMIGRVQTNKVKYLRPYALIHSLDRLELARALSEWAVVHDHSFNCLVQVNIAGDPAKAGIPLEYLTDFLTQAALPRVNIRGLMTMTALEADSGQTREWYNHLAQIFFDYKKKQLPPGVAMEWLSMGMSSDYSLAIRAGANMVRVGSSIFSQEE